MKFGKQAFLGFILLFGAAFLFTDTVNAVTCKLELKRFEDKTSMYQTAGDEEPILRRVRGQYLRWRRDQATTADFAEAVKKEPEYESDTPVPGCDHARFGSIRFRVGFE